MRSKELVRWRNKYNYYNIRTVTSVSETERLKHKNQDLVKRIHHMEKPSVRSPVEILVKILGYCA